MNINTKNDTVAAVAEAIENWTVDKFCCSPSEPSELELAEFNSLLTDIWHNWNTEAGEQAKSKLVDLLKEHTDVPSEHLKAWIEYYTQSEEVFTEKFEDNVDLWEVREGDCPVKTYLKYNAYIDNVAEFMKVLDRMTKRVEDLVREHLEEYAEEYDINTTEGLNEYYKAVYPEYEEEALEGLIDLVKEWTGYGSEYDERLKEWHKFKTVLEVENWVYAHMSDDHQRFVKQRPYRWISMIA